MTLEEHYPGWLAAIDVRRARRSFDGRPVATQTLDALSAVCDGLVPFDSLARVVLVRRAPQLLFMGIAGSYGGVSGAPCALAFVGDRDDPRANAAVGYVGEMAVLEATARGLATCWVGGLFSARHAALLGGVPHAERVYAVSPLGHAKDAISAKERLVFGMGHPKSRRAARGIAPGCEAWPEWAQAGVEAARIAPSAMNRQPWRFRMEGDDVIVSAEGVDTPRISKRLDCGIAMLHFELGAFGRGVSGTWELLSHGDVGRWRRQA